MKTYELIEVDPSPCGSGRPERRTLIAIGSEMLLTQHVKREFNLTVGRPDKFSWDKFYELVPTNVKVMK